MTSRRQVQFLFNPLQVAIDFERVVFVPGCARKRDALAVRQQSDVIGVKYEPLRCWAVSVIAAGGLDQLLPSTFTIKTQPLKSLQSVS